MFKRFHQFSIKSLSQFILKFNLEIIFLKKLFDEVIHKLSGKHTPQNLKNRAFMSLLLGCTFFKQEVIFY